VRQAPVDLGGQPVGAADEDRREEGGEHRDGHDDGQQRGAGRARRRAEPGDDEGELAELRQAQAGPDRGAHVVAAQEAAHRHAAELAGHDDRRDHEHRRRVRPDEVRIDAHADGDEEHGREQVAQRAHELLDLALAPRLGHERAGQEGAERDRVAEGVRQQRQREAQPDAGDEQGLRVAQGRDAADRARHDEEAEHDEPDQEGQQPRHRAGDQRAGLRRA
jgi:hypothetical protein